MAPASTNSKYDSQKNLLGVDYGETNIGLAFGKNGLAQPGPVISGKNDEAAIKEIAKYVIENKINLIVFGLPLSDDGKETHQSQKVRRFAKLLRVFVKLPTEFVDEIDSTREAIENAIANDMPQKRRKTIDNISAAIILKKYFRENE